MDYAASDIDLRLIERFARGDQAAFDALVSRHRRAVFNLVHRMVGDREAAEDVTVEVFFQAYLSLPGFRRQAKFGTWLHRIAINVCLQHLRRPRIKQASAEVPLIEGQLPLGRDIAELILSRGSVAQVIAAMQELSSTQRAAVIMHYLDGRAFAEIAEILEIPTNTAKTRVFHGTKALRDKLRALGILPASRRKGAS